MKLKVIVQTKYVGSKDTRTVTIDDEDVEDLDERGRAAYLEEVARETMFDMISWDWEEA